MKKIVSLLAIIIGLSFGASAQKNAKVAEVKFKTSARCGMCKSRIERDMSLTKGVKTANLDLTDKTVLISYNPKKTNAAKLKTAMSNIGYDADEVVANQKSHDALPGCCQKAAAAHLD
jgi:periplasmic mercuric ion binding protein